ncbi:MAG: SDR family NAD(P)-dependent oxidoreductase [Thermomicrobiales bacterium]
MSERGRVAFITGGGSGIGRAIAHRFTAEGVTIAIADWNLAGAEETVAQLEAAGGEALAIQADVRKGADIQAAVDAAVARFGQVDILVSNAGLSDGLEILTTEERRWDRNFDIIVKGAYHCLHAILPGMIARGEGVVLTIGSVNGLHGIGEHAYSAAKAALVSLTQNVAVRYGQDGIRANCICPGSIKTPIWDHQLETDPHAFDNLLRWYPLGRVGTPEDVANAAWFLCSDEASWISGVTLNVDGGLMAGNHPFSEDLSGKRQTRPKKQRYFPPDEPPAVNR